MGKEITNKGLFQDTTKYLGELFVIAERENYIPEAIVFTKSLIEKIKGSQISLKNIADDIKE